MFEQQELQKFSQAGRVIAAAVGTSVQTWARAEAGVILKAWAGRTPVATLAKTDRRSTLDVVRRLDLTGRNGTTPGDITVNAGIRGPAGRVWVRSSAQRAGAGRPFRLAGKLDILTGAFRPEKYHWRRGTWIDIAEAVADVRFGLARAIPAGRKTIGLARQSIIQIADYLGIRLEDVRGGGVSAAGIAKARAAVASDGKTYQNGLGREQLAPASFVLELINRYPRGVAAGMDATLARVIAGRMKYFERNLAEGTFLSASRAAKAYPYLEVLRAAA